MATIVTASNLNDYVGKTRQELWIKLLEKMEITTFGRLITDVKSKVLMLKLAVADGVRPYRPLEDFVDGDLSYSGTELQVEQWKRDTRVDPWEFLKTPMAGDKTQIPQAARVNEGILAKIAKQLNDTSWNGRGISAYTAYSGAAVTAGSRVSFSGSYYRCITNAAISESPATHPAKYVVENHLAVAKGLGVYLAELIAGSTVTPYATGTVTTSNALTKVQEMWGQLSDAYKKEPMVALMSETTWGKYKAQYRSIIHNNDGMKEVSNLVPDCNENLTIVNFSGMAGSNRIIVTPAENIIIGTDSESDFNNIMWKDTELHYLKATVKGLVGFTFHDVSSELFVSNDAA
jgi:hypothetical protein